MKNALDEAWEWLFGKGSVRAELRRGSSGVSQDPAGFWVVWWKGKRAADSKGKVRVFQTSDGAEKALAKLRKGARR